MKGFINKRDKIKWEDTPFQPEFTGEKLAEMVSGELSLDDLKDVTGTSLIAAGEPFLKYSREQEKWHPGGVYLNDIMEVQTTAAQAGQSLIYDPNLAVYTNRYLPNSNWSLIDTVTADGTSGSEEITLDTPVSSVILDMEMKAGEAQVNTTVTITLTDDTVVQGALIANAIGTNILFTKFLGISFGNLLVSLQGSPTQTGVNAIQGRYNTMLTLKSAASVKIASIEVAAASGVIPASSVIKVYGAQ